MKFKAVKTILTTAQENEQYGEITLRSGSYYTFSFREGGNHKPDIIEYNSDMEVILMPKYASGVSYIDCEAIESIVVY